VNQLQFFSVLVNEFAGFLDLIDIKEEANKLKELLEREKK
jgi:hypothetical protein